MRFTIFVDSRLRAEASTITVAFERARAIAELVPGEHRPDAGRGEVRVQDAKARGGAVSEWICTRNGFVPVWWKMPHGDNGAGL